MKDSWQDFIGDACYFISSNYNTELFEGFILY